MADKKIYEVVLHRAAWYAVEAENEDEARDIALDKSVNEDFEDDDGSLLYKPVIISEEFAKEEYGKILKKS